MSQNPVQLVCTSCGARMRAPEQLAGKTAPCPKCKMPIHVPTASKRPQTLDTPRSSTTAPQSFVPQERSTPPGAQSSLWRPPYVWTAWDRMLVKTGAICIAFGVMSHILPLIGLQFRQLSKLGSSATVGGTGVGLVGLFLIAYVIFLKGQMWKIAVGIVATVVVGFGALLIIGYMSSNRPPRTPPWGNGQFGSGGPGGPMFPAGPNGGPGGPGVGPRGTAFTPPQIPAPPPAIDYASLVTRFGADHVARITLTGLEGIDIHKAVRARMDAWDTAIGGAKPSSWRVSVSGNQAELILAPVGELDALVKVLDLGTVTAMDAAERRVVIEVDK